MTQPFIDPIKILPDYRHNGREFQSSTLSVPEQVMSSNHRSRSDVMRNRSRSPSVPPPHRYRALPHTLLITSFQHINTPVLSLCPSRSLDHGVRGPAHYGPRHRHSEDRYSPDRYAFNRCRFHLFWHPLT